MEPIPEELNRYRYSVSKRGSCGTVDPLLLPSQRCPYLKRNFCHNRSNCVTVARAYCPSVDNKEASMRRWQIVSNEPCLVQGSTDMYLCIERGQVQ